jgi:hypothetical protein
LFDCFLRQLQSFLRFHFSDAAAFAAFIAAAPGQPDAFSFRRIELAILTG